MRNMSNRQMDRECRKLLVKVGKLVVEEIYRCRSAGVRNSDAILERIKEALKAARMRK